MGRTLIRRYRYCPVLGGRPTSSSPVRRAVRNMFFSHSFLDHGSYFIALVRYNNPINILGSILRLQETCYWTSSANKHNSTNNPRTNILHETTSRNSYGWYPSIWMHFHSVILYHELNLESPGEAKMDGFWVLENFRAISVWAFLTTFLDLLHVWIYFPRFVDFDRNVLRNDNSSLLFPLGCWRLSLVVAKVIFFWIFFRKIFWIFFW